jgi:hypothetical protein
LGFAVAPPFLAPLNVGFNLALDNETGHVVGGAFDIGFGAGAAGYGFNDNTVTLSSGDLKAILNNMFPPPASSWYFLETGGASCSNSFGF